MDLQHSWSKLLFTHPHSFTSLFLGQVGRCCVRQSCTPAHSFMSDTELSHCEQFLCGLMLTNELSSASSEKSSQSVDGSGRSESSVFNTVRRETTTLYTVCTTQSYFNGDCRLKRRGSRAQDSKSNDVSGSHAVSSRPKQAVTRWIRGNRRKQTNHFLYPAQIWICVRWMKSIRLNIMT